MTEKLSLPVTKSIPTTEELHGHVLEDEYRWLEDVQSKEVLDWIDQQVAYTTAHHVEYTQYDIWKSRVKEYFHIDAESLPVREGGRHFFTRQNADENLSVLWVREGDNGEERKILDLNEMCTNEGDPSLEYWEPSGDGKQLAYAISNGGAEIPSLHVIDIDTLKDIEPVIPNATGATWNDDATGFYYIRGPKPGTVSENDLRMNSKLYFHFVGTKYEEDPMIFGEDRPSDDMLWVASTRGAPYAALMVRQEWSRNDVFLIDTKTDEVIPFIVAQDAAFGVMPAEKGLVIWTNQEANNAKVLFVNYKDIPKGMAAARVLVPEAEFPLNHFWLTKSRVVVGYVKDISDRIIVYDYDGAKKGEFPSPDLALVTIRTSLDDDTIYSAVQTPIRPRTIYKVDALSLDKKEISRMYSPHNPDEYTSYIEWTIAADGTRLPMIVSHKKDLIRNGKNPTLLYGYGGFAVSEDAGYIGANMTWLEAGGVFVDAVIRGGSEYGERWHKAGILGHKQTSFDDFIAHAENLIRLRVTNPEHLGIYGGSNGGLLVGAAGVQRPELYKAVMSQVPLLDMVHFHTLLIASRWTNEYGNPDNKEDFERILSWSPYHNVRSDIKYPTFYFTTAENDTRVHPMHALKMTAKLQNVSQPSKTLLWVERGSGHTNNVAKTKAIDSIARRLSFFGWQLGLKTNS